VTDAFDDNDSNDDNDAKEHARAPSLLVRGGKQVLAIAGMLGLVAIFAALMLSRDKPEPATMPPPLMVVEDAVEVPAGTPAWGYIRLSVAGTDAPIPPLPVPGRIAVDEARTTRLMAPLGGRVEEVLVRLGQHVQEGEKLLGVRSGALVDLSRDVKLAQTNLNAQRRAFERVKSLVDLKAAAEKDLIGAERELRDAELSLEAAKLKRRSLRVSGSADGRFWILAPRSGAVIERNVMVGQEVGPDRVEPLLTVAELHEVIAIGSVPESDVSGLSLDQAAGVTTSAAPGRVFPGKIEYVSEVVDPLRRTVDVRARVPNAERLLRPNAFVQVAFSPGTGTRLIVPSEALVTDDQRSVVFVQDPATGKLVKRPVLVGRQRDGRVEILKGLDVGETYVSKGALLLLNAVALSK